MRPAESRDSYTSRRFFAFHHTTSARQFLSALGTAVRFVASGRKMPGVPERESVGADDAPFPFRSPRGVNDIDRSFERPTAARATEVTPLSSGTSFVAPVRNATKPPSPLIAGWSLGPFPAAPDRVADTSRVSGCMYAGIFARRSRKPSDGIR